jgi:DNA polymerase-3 subunit gamma/tau
MELSRDGGGSLDVVEIDAASHNGVDDARELRERAVFAPARDRFKIFILDEAHMVTQQGFNALLKIVEEPPEHVKFIFATTEPEKVLPTIRSRTLHYPFRLVPPAEVLSYLQTVVESEQMKVEPGVLALVVRSGGGSIRDTLSILDQLMAGASNNEVSLYGAHALLGFTPRETLEGIIDALKSGDSAGVFSVVEGMIGSGQDPRKFVGDLLSHLRDLIVVHATAGQSSELFPGIPKDEISRWEEQAKYFHPQTLSLMADAVSQRLSEMSGITSPTLQLELLIAQLLTLTGSQQEIQSAPSAQADMAAPATDFVSLSSSSAQEPTQGSQEVVTPSTNDAEEDSSYDGLTAAPSQDFTLELVLGAWAAIAEDIASQKRSVWVALSTAKPVEVSGDILTIGFAKLADAEILKKPQGPGSPLPNAEILREAIQRHTGHRVRFTVSKLEDVTSAEASGEPETGWPVVSNPGPRNSEGDEVAPTEAQVSSEPSSEDAEATTGDTSSVATRGEPVVRQLLGGELVGEEILESMSQQGEADV